MGLKHVWQAVNKLLINSRRQDLNMHAGELHNAASQRLQMTDRYRKHTDRASTGDLFRKSPTAVLRVKIFTVDISLS